MSGYEVEIRQGLGVLWSALEGFSAQANLTLIDSEVKLPDNELRQYEIYNLGNPGYEVDLATASTRPMRETPEYLLNTSLMYDNETWGTQIGVFYSIKGETLMAGGTLRGDYNPDVYALPYGDLSVGISQKIKGIWKLTFRAKNILDPEIETVYRSQFFEGEQTKTSYTKGVGYSASLGVEF